MTEFELIRNYFAAHEKSRPDVILGIGDDTALVTVPSGYEIAVTTDTSVADVHFFASANPFDIGYKSLAVNLSDLAAMGATPKWITLALTLPDSNEAWLKEFCKGLFALADQYDVALIGGDTTRGPLSITIQAMGWVPSGKALRRSSAQPGDLIYVTGSLGDAGAALDLIKNRNHPASLDKLALKLNHPVPRIDVGLALLDIANSAIDISDGLAADLTHILRASKVGAIVYVDQLPISSELIQTFNDEAAIEFALTAGDDYELCFTIPKEKHVALEKALTPLKIPFTCIGEILPKPGLNLCYQDGISYYGKLKGYQHF